MDYGNFFVTDQNADLLHRHVIFYYTPIVSLKGNKYPIYITFIDNSIVFYFDGYILNKNKNEDEDVNDSEIEAIETRLFSLDLTPEPFSQLNLKKTIREIFDNKFPILNTYNINTKNNTNQTHFYDFKDLEIYGKTKPGNKVYFKNIFLDFLQDFFYSGLFKSHPLYTHIKQLLSNNIYIQAILQKTRFYYELKNYNKQKSNFTSYNKFKNKNYAEGIQKATGDWIKMLQRENIYEIIKPIKGNSKWWFNDVEQEMINAKDSIKELIKKSKRKKNKEEIEKKEEIEISKNNREAFIKSFRKIKRKEVEWFINRNNILRAWFTYDKFLPVFITSLILILVLIYGILGFNYLPKNIIYYSILKELKEILIVIFILLIFIAPIRLLNLKKEELLKLWKDKIYLGMSIWLKLVLPRLILLFIGASYIVFELTSYYNKYLTDNLILFYLKYSLLFGFNFIILFKLIRNSWREGIIILNIHFTPFTFSFLISFLVSLIFYLLNNRNIGLRYFFIQFILGLFTLAFSYLILLKDERSSFPNLKLNLSRQKSLSMLFYGLVISFFANLFIINTYYKEFLEKYVYVGSIWEKVIQQKLEKINTKNDEVLLIYDEKNSDILSEKLEEIKNISNAHISDSLKVTMDRVFFNELNHVFVSRRSSKKEIKIFPIIEEFNMPFFSIKIRSIPTILYLNTFLTLLMAIILQIIIHQRKFLLGGEAE